MLINDPLASIDHCFLWVFFLLRVHSSLLKYNSNCRVYLIFHGWGENIACSVKAGDRTSPEQRAPVNSNTCAVVPLVVGCRVFNTLIQE